MTTSKPAFVIFAGAFHLDKTLDLFKEKMRGAGYDIQSATLRTVNNPEAVIQDDVDLMRGMLEPLFEQDRDVVLAIHSYAGFPGSVAIKGQTRRERSAQGLKGGLLGVIYMAAFVPRVGVSLYDMLGGKWQHWHHVNSEDGFLEVIGPKDVFYEDVPEPLASECAAMVKGHSLKAFKTPVPPVGFADAAYNGRRAYLKAGKDQALPPEVQDMFVENSGVEWIRRDSGGGHSPFLATPDELVKIYVELAGLFAKAT